MSKAAVTIPEDRNIPLNDSQMAILYNRSRAWFQRKRWEGGGPAYIKLDGKRGGVLYRRDDADNYFNGRLCKSTSEAETRKPSVIGRA